jgi:hypothetical protein
MTNLETSTAPIIADQEGDHYFMVGDTVYYLNEFMLLTSLTKEELVLK